MPSSETYTCREGSLGKREMSGKDLENGDRERKEISSSMIDSGMMVVIFIILSMIFMVFFVLFTVKHEWCPVLFKNYTVSII